MKKRLFGLQLALSVTLAVAAFTGSAFAQIGSSGADLVFTPVTPCRLVDTRTIYGGTGPILINSTRGFGVWGYSSYAAQGGSPTNCGLTAGKNTAAIAVSMAVVSPAGQGYLTAFPGDVADASKPLAATLNYNAGEVVVSNAAILKVNQGAASPDLKIFSSNTTEVIIDVVGYYSKPVSAGSLECVNSDLKTTSIAANSALLVGANLCAAGYLTTSATCDSSSSGVYVNGSGMNGNLPALGAYCRYFNSSATAQSTYTAATCCRIPGR